MNEKYLGVVKMAEAVSDSEAIAVAIVWEQKNDTALAISQKRRKTCYQYSFLPGTHKVLAPIMEEVPQKIAQCIAKFQSLCIALSFEALTTNLCYQCIPDSTKNQGDD